MVNNAAATMIDIVSSVTRVNTLWEKLPLRRKNNSGGLSRFTGCQPDGSGDSAERLAGRRTAVATEQLANQADHLSSRVAYLPLKNMK